MSVERALISVSDKQGLIPFAAALVARGVTLLSTGGTARALRAADIAVTDVAAFTGAPEMMDGRVKTLHPKIHAGILARRDHAGDRAAMAEHGIEPIDLVVVNLYPFRETAARPDVTRTEAVAQIDIGGPTMIRAAAKNHPFVGVVTAPEQYDAVISALDAHEGTLPPSLRRSLALGAFEHTAAYDAAIASYLAGAEEAEPEGPEGPPELWINVQRRVDSLRYGENPHQPAAVFASTGAPHGLMAAEQLQGKALSYNNYVDADAALAIARDLGPAGVAILKHTNPCGAARSNTGLLDAYDRARACDPTSAFGGVVATAGVIDDAFAARLTETFLEVVLCAGVTDVARSILAKKKRLRVLCLPEGAWGVAASAAQWTPRAISGGTLIQAMDQERTPVRDGRVVSARPPSDEEWLALEFAWTIVRHVKSNAIVFAAADRTLGIGAGQMSRVDASRLAVWKAQESLAGSALASDAFFPFADGVEAAAEAGATAVVQPGGSIRDAEVIAAADRLGLTMVFTGTRHFRH